MCVVLKRLPTCLLSAVLIACASTAGTHYKDGRPCRIELFQESLRTGGGSLAIVNTAWTKMAPNNSQNAAVSRAQEPAMKALLGDFERLGFFNKAVKGTSVPSGSSLAIVLEEGTWLLPKVAMGPQWSTLVAGFNVVWNSGNRSIGHASTGRGTSLEQFQKQLEAENQRRMRELKRRRRR
ncbi:MAG: hypothetical protein CMJ85_08660 [Planctomycetes bacterium]|jgi:hypothetical protein|nr:hypothetical protein [Planctomycetota bacterium]